ncbi:ATP-binding cassette domain-containing protein [Gleimia hominis]|uniref:ATP-binding cassette domain-containing protein n=1 Tax=Gleimia hominis TaxID=595468 RepID=UPI0035E45339
MQPPCITIEKLQQGYGRTTVLEGISTELSCGTIALLGKNGAGKTTLLRTLAGQLKPQAGRILLNGADVYSNKYATRTSRIGYLPQRMSYDPHLQVSQFWNT